MSGLVTIGVALVRRLGVAFTLTTVGLVGLMIALSAGNSAYGAIVPGDPLNTAGNYSVLANSTVTNTGFTILNNGLGLSPGTSVTGFPPGTVVPPATTDVANAAAIQAQTDLSTAYTNAAGRPVGTTTAADLGGLTLQGGVYATTAKNALGLTGALVLDGAGNPDTVFIFQTNSTLTTAANSTVTLINGAQECHVFWQVGSSATLGATSDFTGNILAQTAITVGNATTVHGRALAEGAAVALSDDMFTQPTCAAAPATTTTTSPVVPTTTTTSPATTSTTATSIAPTTTTTSPTPTTITSPASTSTTATPTGPITAPNAITTSTLAAAAAAVTTTTSDSSAGVTADGSAGSSVTTTGTGVGTGVGTGSGVATGTIDTGVGTSTAGGVTGPPQTGGAALQKPRTPWLPALITSLIGVVGTTLATVIYRTRRP